MSDDYSLGTYQIIVPPILPTILKRYAKAAIRTQPYDLLIWSAAYFKALASDKPPPVKTRLEYPPVEPFALSKGYVKLLIQQFGKTGQIPVAEIKEKWQDVCLPNKTLSKVLKLGQFIETVDVEKFVALLIGFVEQSLRDTMISICEILSSEPDGGSAMLDAELFLMLYRYLAEMDCGEQEKTKTDESQRDQKGIIRGLDEEGDEELDKRYRMTSHQPPLLPEELRTAEAALESHVEGKKKADNSVMTIETMDESNIAFFDIDKEEIKPYDLKSTSESDSMCAFQVFEDVERVELVRRDSLDFPIAEALKQETGVEKSEDKDETKSVIADNVPVVELFKDLDMETSADLMDYDEEMGDSNKELLTETSEASVINRNERCIKPMNVFEETNDQAEPSTLFLYEEKEGEPEANCSEREISSDSSIGINLFQLEKEVSVGAVLKEKISLDEMRFTRNAETRKGGLESHLDEDNNITAYEESGESIDIQGSVFKVHVKGIGPSLPEEIIRKVEEYVRCCALSQAGVIMPRNLKHFTCPPLMIESQELRAEVTKLLEEDQLEEENISREKSGSILTSVMSTLHLKWDEILSDKNSDISSAMSYEDDSITEAVRVGPVMTLYDMRMTINKDTFMKLIEEMKTEIIEGGSKGKRLHREAEISDKSLVSTETEKGYQPVWYMNLLKTSPSNEMDVTFENIKNNLLSSQNSEIITPVAQELTSMSSPSVGEPLEPRLGIDDMYLLGDAEILQASSKRQHS